MSAPFLQAAAAGEYVRIPGTSFLVQREGSGLEGLSSDASLAQAWREKQEALMKWTRDSAMFNEADVSYNFSAYDRFFAARGPLAGRVLDIGGGWGLFRQWWSEAPEACFTVHDPGVERFTVEPPPVVQKYFAAARAKPGWFVQGVGERLPYEDASYDLVLIVQALDHFAEPARALAEVQRVLRPGGSFLILQGFEHEHGAPLPPSRRLGARLASVLSDPRRLLRSIKTRLFHRGEAHLHHFTQASLTALVRDAEFGDCRVTLVDERLGICALESRKHA